MAEFPKYHSALFREFGEALKVAAFKIMEESVMHLSEADHAHPERIGRLNGLLIAAQIAEKLDKQISGAP